MNEWKTIAALHQIAGATFGQGEAAFSNSGTVRLCQSNSVSRHFWHCPDLLNTLGEFREISAGLYFLEDVFSFLAGLFGALRIYFSIGARKRRLDQNMPDVYLFGDTNSSRC